MKGSIEDLEAAIEVAMENLDEYGCEGGLCCGNHHALADATEALALARSDRLLARIESAADEASLVPTSGGSPSFYGGVLPGAIWVAIPAFRWEAIIEAAEIPKAEEGIL